MRHLTRAAILVAAVTALPQTGAAQSEEEFLEAFSGDWYVFDQSFRQGDEPCALTLETASGDGRPAVSSTGCAAPLDAVVRWDIRDGRIFLSASDGEVAALGGNQLRVTGEISAGGRSLVVERAQGDGSSRAIAQAIREHRCYYRGFTQTCADSSALETPEIDAETGFATVETLANLNVRAQPRRDAAVMGTIALGTPVRVNQCLTASDGTWCRARFGNETGWLAMTALRQDEWPVLAFEEADAPAADDNGTSPEVDEETSSGN